MLVNAHIATPHFSARNSFSDAWSRQGLYSARTLAEDVILGAERYPATRLIFGSRDRPSELTVPEVLRQAVDVATNMAALGYRPGDVLVSQIPNWHENAVLFVAALYLGLVYIPVVHIYGAKELRFILSQSGARGLALPDRWKNIDFGMRLEEVGALPQLEHVFVVGNHPMPGRTLNWSLLAKRPAAPVPRHNGCPDDVCAIVFTSGTTSDPKGVMHTHRTLSAETRTFPPAQDAETRGARLWPTPGGHIAALVSMLSPFLLGETTVYMDHFDGPLAVELIREHGVRCAGGVPLMHNIMMDTAGPGGLPSCTLGTVGGAGVPPSVIERSDKFGIRLVRAYGSSEHPTVTSCQPEDSLPKRKFTDGKPLPGNRIRIVDDEGREVKTGEAGEILSIGPELFVGYLDSSLNTQFFTAEGWFHTGDIGVLDTEGYLTIVDRKKDIIIRGGENISSQEVENVLCAHPAVMEAAAVAWPDETMGERVGVFVRLRNQAQLDLDSVRAHFSAAGVARQKTPERLVIVEDFPRTPLGKIIKTALRKQIPEMKARTRVENP
ncbi:MAG TPA: AMP-binding protein [Burkholderiales bacterium]|nr:AMP-binding protein [Burkholderiales bacterium]